MNENIKSYVLATLIGGLIIFIYSLPIVFNSQYRWLLGQNSILVIFLQSMFTGYFTILLALFLANLIGSNFKKR